MYVYIFDSDTAYLIFATNHMHTTITNIVNKNAAHTSGLQVTKYDSEVARLTVYLAYNSYLQNQDDTFRLVLCILYLGFSYVETTVHYKV